MNRYLLPFLSGFSLTLCFAGPVRSQSAPVIDFDLDVKSILSDRCFTCHGPDESQRVSELRLDSREGLYQEVDGLFADHAVVPGSPEQSELYRRIVSDDPDAVMPPSDSPLKLSATEKQVIKQWIEQGAKWKGHWAFQPIEKPPLPARPSAPGANDHPIDRFIDRELQRAELTASPLAEPYRQVSRVYFDLIGVAPTPQQVREVINHWSDQRYEQLVDQLLANPQFGERMASEWLDVARYSDTYGYQVDRDRHVWPWRDWVINAINDNMPLDQFLTEQIAGDLLPGATDQQILATTFNRLHPQKVEGGSVPEEFRIEYVADRTQTFATAVLGLTMECARCHDHKYDPLLQKEYYGLSAFFDNIDEAGLYSYFTPSVPTPTLDLVDQSYRNRIAELSRNIAKLESSLEAIDPAASEDYQTWLAERDPTAGLPGLAKHHDFESVKGPNRAAEGKVGQSIELTGDDGFDVGVGNFPRYQPFSVALWIKSPKAFERTVIFHRSRAWTDAASRGYELLMLDGRLQFSLIHFWPGNAISIALSDPFPVQQWQHVVITYDGSSQAAGLRFYVNGSRQQSQVVRDHLTRQITGGGNDNITIGARFRDIGFKAGQVDEFQVFDRELSAIEAARIAGKIEALTGDDSDLAALYRLTADHKSASLREQLKEARKKLAAMRDSAKEIMVMKELASPRQTYVLTRGMYDARAEPVDPLTPGVLPGFQSQWPANRLGLAKWACSPNNPLTSRVAVNRYWQMLFGEGLVRTPEDFGTQGARPTHPELLDWLAAEFMESGWDVKRLLRSIVLSSAYRRDSDCDQSVRERDPENLLLARAPRFRLSAEMLRDSALQTGNLIDRQIGGPPVSPYELAVSFKPRGVDKGARLYRRSVYTFWKRTGPPPVMMALDASKRDVCRLRRERTSSPLQSLVILNNPQFLETARFLAMNALHDSSDAAEAIAHVFEKLTGRVPGDRERDILLQLFEKQLQRFKENPAAADSLLGIGATKTESDLPIDRWAAMTIIASTLYSYDQSLMRR